MTFYILNCYNVCIDQFEYNSNPVVNRNIYSGDYEIILNGIIWRTYKMEIHLSTYPPTQTNQVNPFYPNVNPQQNFQSPTSSNPLLMQQQFYNNNYSNVNKESAPKKTMDVYNLETAENAIKNLRDQVISAAKSKQVKKEDQEFWTLEMKKERNVEINDLQYLIDGLDSLIR